MQESMTKGSKGTGCLRRQLAPVLPRPAFHSLQPSTAVNGMWGVRGEVSAGCSGDGGK